MDKKNSQVYAVYFYIKYCSEMAFQYEGFNNHFKLIRIHSEIFVFQIHF